LRRDRLDIFPPATRHQRRNQAGKPLIGLFRFAQPPLRFVQWYNDEHRHSGIRYVTPAQRHAGQDGPVLAARHVVYQDARSRNPQRWSGQTRNWKPVGAVTLNPERDIIIRAATSQILLSGSIGEPAFPSRPGSAQAAERNAGDGRSRATRSHAQRALSRASMARMASTGPSPQ
jgi:hypothetical protein